MEKPRNCILIENTYKTPLTHPGYLEPHGCLVYIDDEGIVQVWNNNDTPNGAHQELAREFDLDADNINFNVIFLFSIIFSFFISFLTIKYFLIYVKSFDLKFFVYYRIFLAFILFIVVYV